MTVRPFQIAVPDDALDDLRIRLTRTRFTTASDPSSWAAGVDPDYLHELIDHWAVEFDWRRIETALNAFPHFLTEINGRDLHFIHVRGTPTSGAPAPLPLVLSHGWPSTFFEMLQLVGPLTEPVAHGHTGPAFDVVIPSLPGFAFSQTLPGPFTREAVGEVWDELMTDVLGYERYGLFGGDIGGGVSCWAAAKHPEHVAGLHVIHPPFPSSFDPPPTPKEQAFLDAEEAYDVHDRGYSEIMWTRPDTIAAALIDSPAGLAAWIADKYRDWSDHGGDLESVWGKDSILTMAMLYWVTDSIGTSFRQYYDYRHNAPRPQITVPTAVTLSHEPSMANVPRSLAERATTDLRHWSEPMHGGHFLAFEQPALMTAELRTFFGQLR